VTGSKSSSKPLKLLARNMKSKIFSRTFGFTAQADGGVFSDYLPELQRAREQREKTLDQAKEKAKADNLARAMKDIAIDRERNPAAALADRWKLEEEEEEEEEEDDMEINLIDRCEY
jgi:hypothetical protein